MMSEDMRAVARWKRSVSPTLVQLWCPECRWCVTQSRRQNALAREAKLRSAGLAHWRNKHAPKVSQS